MPEYKTGGVTKVGYFQRIPNYGSPSAATKLVYKKMTFGALVDGYYSRDHRNSSEGETQYKDIFYNKDFYKLISQQEERHIYERNQRLSAALNAKYVSDHVYMVHAISFARDKNPGSGYNSINHWSDNLFDGFPLPVLQKV